MAINKIHINGRNGATVSVALRDHRSVVKLKRPASIYWVFKTCFCGKVYLRHLNQNANLIV